MVWQQDRFRRRAVGERIRPWSPGEAPGPDGHDLLAVKFTYWLDI